VLAVIAVAMGALGIHLHRHPKSLVVADDEIRLEPGAPTQRIQGAGGTLRLRTIGSARYRQIVLDSTDRDGQIPLAHFRRDEVAEACHRHGWTFGG
jgi:hypothetical protein